MARPLLIQANALHIPLADQSVHCVLTSPPYLGLRDYGTGTWDGGDPTCTHATRTSTKETTITTESRPTNTNHEREGWRGGMCGRCGARKTDQQLGLEETPQDYVAGLAQVFREVKRVLRDDGVLWLNLGDSYNAAGRAGHGTRQGMKQGRNRASAAGQDWCRPNAPTLREKQLLGIPWRVAFALQDDGWILRSDIIWDKPSCMPESVQDRPTRSHEYVFLLTKQPRYYYNAEAIREPNSDDMQRRARFGHTRGATGKLDVSRMDTTTLRGTHAQTITADGRNARSVWRIPAEGFAGAHFAVMPTALARTCLLAGCPPCGTVLDMFCGSGTTLLVARELGLSGVGLDLSWPFLHTVARGRLGFTDLDAWTHGQQPSPVTFDDLPLFRKRSA